MSGESDAGAVPSSHRVRDWHPGWMGVVLGTGGMAVAGLVDPLPFTTVDEAIGASLTVVALVLLPVLLVPYAVRQRRHRDAVATDFGHPGLGAMYGTVPASLLIVGLALAQVAVIGWLPSSTAWISAMLLGAGLVGAVAVGVAFFAGIVAREAVPPEAMSGAWFIPIVVLVLVPSVMVRLVLLQPGWRTSSVVVLAAACVGAGLMLFLVLAPVIAWRLITSPSPAAHQAASWWIWLAPAGAGGLGVLATARLAIAEGGTAAVPALALLGLVVATGMWGFAVWWSIFAGRVLVTTARRGGLPFSLGSWGFAFPTAALTALTVELGRSWDVPVLAVMGAAGFVAGLLIWVRLAVQTVQGIRRGGLLVR
jgi:C4-dicarboxylate transporter/malic acid transport protein